MDILDKYVIKNDYKEFLEKRIPYIKEKFGANWRQVTNKFNERDIRFLNDESLFRKYDAERKTKQYKKDFINDQDSSYGMPIIDNIIKNILCVKQGTLGSKNARRFGFSIDELLFEQLTDSSLIFARHLLFNDFALNLPDNVNVIEIDIKSINDENLLEISVMYEYRDAHLKKFEHQEPGPDNPITRKVNVVLNRKV